MKGCIDAGDHVAFKTGLSQNFGLLDWRPGPVKFGPKFNNTPILGAPPRRTPNPNLTNFSLTEFKRLAASVKGLNSSLAIAAGEL